MSLRLWLCLPILAAATDVQPEAVHDFWDDTNKQHTFHFAPAWPNEVAGGKQFYAFRDATEGYEPVYDWWDNVNKQHTFHFPPAWKHGETDETQGDIQFYASAANGADLEPIAAYWDDSNKQHTFHLAPEWKHGETTETKGDTVFYAFKTLNQATTTTQLMTTGAPTEPPVTAKMGFNQGAPMSSEEDFLERCNFALKAKGVTCTGIVTGEGGVVEVDVSGPADAVEELQIGWPAMSRKNLDELGTMIDDYGAVVPVGKPSPEVGTAVSACASLGYAKALIVLAVGCLAM